MGSMPVVAGVIILISTAVAAPRRAGADSGAPEDLVSRALVLSAGAVEVRLVAGIDLQRQGIGRPLSLSPDAWWGLAPGWTIGVIHSDTSVDQFDVGATFCVRQSDVSPCDRLYRGGGVDVRYSALEGALGLAPRVRLLVRDVDPFKPAVTLGTLLRWTAGRYAITSDPYLRLPLANRTEGNRVALSVPIWLAVQPARGWQLAVHAGYDADLAVLGDGWHGPLSLAVSTRITSALDLDVEAGWPRLLGPQHDGRHGAVLLTADWHQ
ncbi:MAG TPA: hypothetical protein VFT22_20600 [Kofleriaceae bacterium]|nr:hypothetical protein [Kofleriaceae bacterium]